MRIHRPRPARGFSVFSCRLAELLAALKRDAGAATARLRRRSCLALRCWSSTRWASAWLELRYGRGSILITTNKGIKDWPELLAGDEVLATAILDRLLHHSHVLNIKGRRYRLRDLEQAAGLQPSANTPPVRNTGCRLIA
ncbi:MAG: ATP-binding protein [Halofilum sp. (in: g-proteobacteria)]|nr:ATP-binding protein [Halofilum sp. (in: g-proteobacteria)]